MGSIPVDYASWQGVTGLNDVAGVQAAVLEHPLDEVYVFTLHEIYLPYHNLGTSSEDLMTEVPVFQQTRSSPNWQGPIQSTDSATGSEVVKPVVSFATCKQNMRTYREPSGWGRVWTPTNSDPTNPSPDHLNRSVWLLMLTPKHCANNAVFCLGQIGHAFESNYDYGRWCRDVGCKELVAAKSANEDIRGDLYRPKRQLAGEERYDPRNFEEPRSDHTRMERYPNGKPKWHKDIEFRGVASRRPPVFVFSKVFLFNQPVLYSRWSGKTGRAVNRCQLRDL